MKRRARPLLGTLVEIAVVPPAHLAEAHINQAISAAFSRIENISHTLSFHRQDSELTRLNSSPNQWCPFSRDGIRLLRLSRALGQMTNNIFNCTVGGELVNKGALPNPVSHDFIAEGQWQDIDITHSHARLNRPILITLDGIAKGYAVDTAVAVLRQSGIESGWINAGGDLKVFGSITLPVMQRNNRGISQRVHLKNVALASSKLTKTIDKDYPAFIITPPNNKQSANTDDEMNNGIISVQSPFAWRADALTKVGALMTSHAFELVNQLGGKIINFEHDGF